MRNKRDVIHMGQIPTKLGTVKSEIFNQGTKAIHSLFNCLVSEQNSFRQKNHIVITAALFERISCLVYYGKEGYYQKPTADKYSREIFKRFAETPEEVYDRIKRYGATKEKADRIYKLVWQVADLICPMMACVVEQASIGEYAYAIEYVIRHNGDLPKPEISILFPSNYADYRCQGGIAETIRYYEVGQQLKERS